ncbi:hypothetical protein ACLI4Z_04680 [Natrialbaceae archaeon A-arb3/5]
MKRRQRIIVSGLWIAVAAVMATTLGFEIPPSVGDVARLSVIALALFLAVVYLLDPWGITSQKRFH